MIVLASLGDIGNTLMTPFYWLISSVLIFFHWLFSFVLPANSGITWLIAIVFLTCTIRGIMLPLYAKQLNSQRAMTALQPKMKAVREKYANDRQRQGAETMKLYEENGVSPYASCLPMVVQMPVFISVFWVISPVARATFASTNPYVLDAASQVPKGMFAQRLDLVYSFQNSTIFGSSLSQTFLGDGSTVGTKVLSIVLMIGMMATLFYQQWYMMKRNMPPSMLEGPMGQQQKIMLYVFPFIYLFSGLAVPLGVMFYWLISNVWTMMQQYFMVRVYPTPDTPAYAEWEDRMIAQGKDPVAIERQRIEEAKSKRKGGLTSKIAAAARNQGGNFEEAKQEVTETTGAGTVTRTDSTSGKTVVVRQQPHKKSRAKRKH
ncbi:MAG: membrane protein insertase YidC [Propionibacteriaceae bacterium]|nr:membrane protein insertase YidC [Propionibacteriaceae bacterium]